MTTTVSYRQTAPGTCRLTFDGRILGDSPGYTREAARAEARRICDEARARARREGRGTVDFIYRPGF